VAIVSEVQAVEKKRHRSPRFPGIDLEEAIAKAKEVNDRESGHPAPPEVMFKHWGYTSKSSSAHIALAALKSYGLLERDGHDLRLTELAFDLVHEDPDPSRRLAARRKAALTPAIYAELWQKYEGNVPSDESLRYHLKRDRGFPDRGADEFIRIFRATISFAELGDGTLLSEVFSEKVKGTPTINRREESPPKPPLGQGKPGMNQDTLTLDEGQVVLQWPASISPENYEDLKDWLELMSRRIKRAVSKDTSYTLPGGIVVDTGDPKGVPPKA